MSSFGVDIKINVYDLHKSNSYLHCIGTGFYHTGVQIESFEYSFSDQGVVRTRVQKSGVGNFRQSINMGKFPGTLRVIKDVLCRLRTGDFAAGTYDIIQHNCNHFSEALVYELLELRLPSWINLLAETAKALQMSRLNSSSAANLALVNNFAFEDVADPKATEATEAAGVDSRDVKIISAYNTAVLHHEKQQEALPSSSLFANSTFSTLGNSLSSFANNIFCFSSPVSQIIEPVVEEIILQHTNHSPARQHDRVFRR